MGHKPLSSKKNNVMKILPSAVHETEYIDHKFISYFITSKITFVLHITIVGGCILPV